LYKLPKQTPTYTQKNNNKKKSFSRDPVFVVFVFFCLGSLFVWFFLKMVYGDFSSVSSDSI